MFNVNVTVILRLTHGTNLSVDGFGGAVVNKLICLLNQMVFHQTADLYTCHRGVRDGKASHHVVNRKLLG